MKAAHLLVCFLFITLSSISLADDHTIINVIGRYRVSPWQKRSLSGVKYLVVHHSAMRGDGEDEGMLRALQKIHVNTNRWPGLSYHYVIMKNGNIYQINNLDDRTYTDTINTDSVAILLNGYFHAPFNEQPSSAQLDSLEFMLRKLMPQFGLTKANIRGHRDRTQTACPGDILYAIVQRYKTNGVPSAGNNSPAENITNRLPAGKGCVQVDVNLRDGGRLRGNVIAVVPQGGTGTIHPTQPVSEDGYIWYDVTMGANRGWMAQTSKDKATVYLKSCPDGAPADPNGGRDVTVGTEFCLTESANQRTTPCGNLVTTHTAGTRVTVVADPNNGVDNCGWIWYKVKAGGSNTLGWMAKGPWFGFCTGAAEYDPNGLDSSVWNKLTPEERAALEAEGMAAGEDQSSSSIIATSFALFLFSILIAF